jgi:hypothetical protein
MNGRYLSVNWSIDELVARKEEIVAEDKLKVVVKGTLERASLRTSGIQPE